MVKHIGSTQVGTQGGATQTMSLGFIGLGVIVAAIWGFNFVVAHEAVSQIPPLLLVALRYLAVAVAFLPFTRRNGLSWRYIIMVGLFYGVVQFSGLFLGLYLGVGAGVAATVIQSQALFTILLASVLLGETFRWIQWFGLALGGLGLIIIAVASGGAAPLPGVLCVLAGGAGWAGANIILKRAGKISAWTMTVWQSVVVIPAMLLLSAMLESGQWHAISAMSLRTFGAILYIALLATGLGNFVWYRLVQGLGPSRAAPFSLLVPVVGIIAGWLVRGEHMSNQQITGIIIILLGLAVIQVSGLLSSRMVSAPVNKLPLEKEGA